MTDKTVVGDTASDFATLANGKNVTIKQAAAGEPVVIDFNNAKTDLLKGHYYYLGHTQLNWLPVITTLMLQLHTTRSTLQANELRI